MSQPPSQGWRPRASGGPSGVPIRHHREGRQAGAGGVCRTMGVGCQLDFPRRVTLFPNLALLPADPRESQCSEPMGL